MEGREFRWRILVAMAEKTALIESQCKADWENRKKRMSLHRIHPSAMISSTLSLREFPSQKG